MSENMAKCPKCNHPVIFVLLGFTSAAIAAECAHNHRFTLDNGLSDCAQFFPISRLQEEREGLLKALRDIVFRCRLRGWLVAQDRECRELVKKGEAAIKKAEANQ